MEEVLKIIEGYNQEKNIITERLSSMEIFGRLSYDNSVKYIESLKKRIIDIDNKLLDIIKNLSKKQLD